MIGTVIGRFTQNTQRQPSQWVIAPPHSGENHLELYEIHEAS